MNKPLTKDNKPFYKRGWFIALAVIFVVGAIGNALEDKEKETETSQVVEEEPIVEEENENIEEIEEEVELTPFEQIESDSRVSELEFKEGVAKISLDATNALTLNAIPTHYVFWGFEHTKTAFDDESVNEVILLIKTTLIDNKGNESEDTVINIYYTRETFEQLNYEGFINLAYSQEWRILNESDEYFIHPAIYNEMKEEIRNNLTYGNSK